MSSIPKTQSPGASFFSTIAGYDAVASGKANTLSGVKVIDPHTVEIDLSQPDASFLHKMALNFAFVVPKEEVEKYGADFGKHPVGTGAFKMDHWTLGQELVFVRNPDYWQKGIPHLDKITFQFGQAPIVALLRLQRGEIDIAGDGIPPAKFLEVMKDPKTKNNIVEGEQLQTGYITLNATMKPFDNVKVRQAVNMAINKKRIIQIINGRAIPAKEPLPPLMPGYDKDMKGYGYDPAGARKLLAEAGYPKGFSTELYVYNTDPNPRIAQAIQQDLSQIGIKAAIKSLDQANVISAGGSKEGVPMIWSGRHGVDRRLSGPVGFLLADPGLRRRGARRMELGEILQQVARRGGEEGRRHRRSGQAGRAQQDVGRHLRQGDEGRAVGAGVPREALHDPLRPDGRDRTISTPIRSISRSTTTTSG